MTCANKNKNKTNSPINSAVYSQLPKEIGFRFKDSIPCSKSGNILQIFTDGSIEGMSGGPGIVIRSTQDYLELGETFNYPTTILDCELAAIRLALQTIISCTRPRHTHIILYSDCLAAIKLIHGDQHNKRCSKYTI